MKTFLKFFIVGVFMLPFVSCKKDEDNSIKQGQLEFALNILNSNTKKSTGLTPSSIEFTIESANGSFTKDYKLNLLAFNDVFICEPISLEPGKYKLTRFLVNDSLGSTIYACPKELSPRAYLVKDPLDIEFSIEKDFVTKLIPEVLNSKGANPKDFGYADASFKIVNVIDFQVGVFVYNEDIQNFELTEANLEVKGDNNTLYSFKLGAITNLITVNDSYNIYRLSFTKEGYEPFAIDILKDSLSNALNNPLIITLSKSTIDLSMGLVAYYPFNGNANDESGNGNNGMVFGATLANDKAGNAGAAYSFYSWNEDRIMYGDDPIGDDESVSVSIDIFPTTPLHNNLYSRYDNEYVLSTGGQTISAGYYILWNNGKFEVGRHTNYSKCDTLFGNFEPNSWYNLIMTFDKATGIEKIYVNGSLYISMSSTTAEINNHKYKDLCVGIANTSYLFNNQWSFNGSIDEVRIYNRVLEYAEIAALSK